MKNIKSLLLTIVVLALGFGAYAQKVLTIDEAMALALKNNFDISVSKSEAAISATNNTAGAAGMLPSINLTGSGNYALKQTGSKASENEEYTNQQNGIATLNAGAELSWTIFDGGKMFVAKSKLNEIEALGEIRYKQQVLQTMADVISAYYNVVKQKQQLAAIEQIIKYNNERVTIAETAFKTGSKSKTDLLQAKIDLNVNQQNAINQKTAIETARRELARKLVTDSNFDVSSEVTFNYTPDRDELNQRIYSQNATIQAFEKQLAIEKLQLKENYRTLLPQVNLSGGYYFQHITINNFDADNRSQSRSLWPQIGASMVIPIFRAGNLQRQVALSKIEVDIAQYNLENTKNQVNTELLNALNTFESQQQLLTIEKENNELARENLDISLQRMRLGEATSLEVRMAQNDFEESATRLTNYRYALKIAETRLKQLLGEL